MWHRSFDRETLCRVSAPSGDDGTIPTGSSTSSFHSLEAAGTSLYVPDSYTPGYAYPLICHLHDDDQSEAALWRWFPEISDQNFLGLGLRGPFPGRLGIPGQYRWAGRRPDASLAVIRRGVESLAADWSVNPDRIFLFGEGRGALTALQQFLLVQTGIEDSQLDIAGVICRDLHPCWPRLLPHVQEELRGRLLILDPQQNIEALAAVDALVEAGVSVHLNHSDERPMAAVINHWVLAANSTAVF